MDGITKDVLGKEGVLEIMDFDYLAYGNAHQDGGNITCQHGAMECLGNMAETCVKNMTGNAPLKYIPFAKCLEVGPSIFPVITEDSIRDCAGQHGIDGDALMSCVHGPLGRALTAVEAKKTEANFAGKAKRYVPYFTLNGKEFKDGEGPSLLKAVCDYWAGEKPAGCGQAVKQP